MEEKRKFSRCFTQLDARFLKEGEREWEEATIINISRKGMGIKFRTSVKINISSTLHLAIIVSGESDPIMVKGVLGWIKQKENYFIGGIELTESLDESNLSGLSSVYAGKDKTD